MATSRFGWRQRRARDVQPCATPGCPTLVPSGHCVSHARRRDARRGSARARGYTSAWDEASLRFRAVYPLCGMRPDGRAPVMSKCHDLGLVTAATQTDHVVPHRGDETLFWDRDNWQSLCGDCHRRKTARGF